MSSDSPFLLAVVVLGLSEPALLRRQGERGCSGLDAAGVMVLSEVAWRLMMMSGADASTSAAEYGRAVTRRINEVVTTAVPAGHR
jgi:hypothetical protein